MTYWSLYSFSLSHNFNLAWKNRPNNFFVSQACGIYWQLETAHPSLSSYLEISSKCQKCVKKVSVSGIFIEYVWKISLRCLQGVWKMSGRCLDSEEGVRNLSSRCLEGVLKVSERFRKRSRKCLERFWKGSKINCTWKVFR